MSKGAVEISADFSELGHTMGLLSGMSKTVKTNRYMGDVITYVHDQLAQQFNLHMDQMVEMAPERFSHVYEWKHNPGAPDDRLWTHKLLGSGGNRNATFVWRASVKPIATPQERKASNPDDPIAQVPDEELAKLSKRRYVFYWKAPIMEYDLGVTITPKYAEALFIPTGDPSNPFVFVNYYRNLQPGGQNNTGQFSAEWANWWGTAAPILFEESMAGALEKDLEGSVKNGLGIRKGTRVRAGKTASLTATSDYHAAFQSGEAWAERYVEKRIRDRKRARR